MRTDIEEFKFKRIQIKININCKMNDRPNKLNTGFSLAKSFFNKTY